MASFGENLRRERELRGVDLREMAEATKISIRFLQAIEQDRVDILPGGIFPKAFVRQYARHLGLDPERLVAEFVFAHGGDTGLPRGPRAPVHVDRGIPRGLVVLVVALGLLGLVGWKVRGQATRAPEPRTPSVAAPPLTTFAHDRVYPPPSAAADSASPFTPGVMVLSVTARQSSWVEAKVDGTTVLNRVLKEGESQRLEARREFVLSVGNAGGLALTLNDRPLAPLGRSGEVKRNVVVSAQTAPALMTVPGSSAAEATPRPVARPATPRPAPPSPSPTPSLLVLEPRPDVAPVAPPATRPPSPLPQP